MDSRSIIPGKGSILPTVEAVLTELVESNDTSSGMSVKRVEALETIRDECVRVGIKMPVIAKTIMDGLTAMKSQLDKYGDVIEIGPDYGVRHKYLETTLKLFGFDEPPVDNSTHLHITNVLQAVRRYEG